VIGSIAAGLVVIAAGVYELTPLKQAFDGAVRRAPAPDSKSGCAAPAPASA